MVFGSRLLRSGECHALLEFRKLSGKRPRGGLPLGCGFRRSEVF